MTKEEYIKLLESEEIPIEVFFSFYKERGGTLDDLYEFAKIFATAISNEWVVHTPNGAKKITYQSCVDNFLYYYNKKFEINEYKKSTSGGSSSFIFI